MMTTSLIFPAPRESDEELSDNWRHDNGCRQSGQSSEGNSVDTLFNQSKANETRIRNYRRKFSLSRKQVRCVAGCRVNTRLLMSLLLLDSRGPRPGHLRTQYQASCDDRSVDFEPLQSLFELTCAFSFR